MQNQHDTKKRLARWLFSLAVLVGSLFLIGTNDATAAEKPWNFVLILVDDMGWTDLSVQGSTYYETPNIDRLAASGMRFTDGYAACAVCSPTRAAVQTGRYPARLGVTDWIRAKFQGGTIGPDGRNPTGYEGRPHQKLLCPRNALFMELDEITLAELLKPAGYTSCHIGKWHLGQAEHFPTQQGYDENHGGCDLGQPPGYFDPYKSNRKHYEMVDMLPRKKGEYLTDREADEAAKFILANRDKPFFLSMCHYAVHTPIQAKKDLIAKYDAKPKTNQKNSTYAGMVESVDDAAGTILAALDQAGVSDRTVVIFTSDNGGLLGPTDNAPLRNGKGYPWEGGIREPWIVRWPGVVKPGTTCSVPISSVDIFPTVAQIADVPLPADRAIDGESIVSLLKESGSLKRDALYWHFPHYRNKQQGPYSIIRQGDWKLIRHYDSGELELYNLADDLSETTNLVDKMPKKAKQLETKLDTWLESVDAKMPKPNPEYRGT